jgi:hypothetical protein
VPATQTIANACNGLKRLGERVAYCR